MEPLQRKGFVWTGLVWLIVIFFEIGLVSAQGFGKNKVQYRQFDWRYIQSKHFDVYYYGEKKQLPEFVADVAESSLVSMKKDFRYNIEKRIPILVYNSHNDFAQTNVIYFLIEESIGGFTEAFKDRIVIPFQGNYEEFRNLIHHELTHAVMYQMLYGKNFGSAIASMARFQVPLWLAEGLAEYESIGWDTESDMFMRDATLNGYLPPIDQLYGFMAYKGGQSVLHYIAEKYGGPKIGELLGKVRINRNMELGLKQSIGLNTMELTKRWHKHLRKTYWPDVQGRDEPADMARRLTDHNKYNYFINNSPALSPRGDKMIYLTNRSDYIDIYLMSVIDGRNLGRLVQGERSEIFEELHWLRPGMDWSPDGKQIVFASKMGDKDAIHILDVETRSIVHSYTYPLDGIFSPHWSPDGEDIVFMGLRNGQSDLYLMHISTDDLRNLTDDVFSDIDPIWSPDGQEIAFISDRGPYIVSNGVSQEIQKHNYKQQDLYTIHVQTGEIRRLTIDSAAEKSPAFSPQGDKIAFISDRNGINNIYIMDVKTGEDYAISNLLTGVSQISWSRDGSRLAFSSFYDAGYDIYLINNPLDIKPGSIQLEKTAFMLKNEQNGMPVLAQTEDVPEQKAGDAPIYRNYVFGDAFRKKDLENKKLKEETFFDTTEYKSPEGNYKTRRYKIKFTPDLIAGGAGYSQFFGLQGSTMIAFSDILGNHQINLYTDLFYSLKNSNFQLAYYYLPKQTDFGISVFHYSYLYYTYSISLENGYPTLGYIRDRNYGLTMILSRPFNKYRRIDFGVTGLGIERDFGDIDPYGFSGEYMHEIGNIYKRRVLFINLGYNADTVIWGMTGPTNGGRSYIGATYSPSISKEYGLDFWTVRGDWRKYIRIKKFYSLALRVSGGVSGGKNPQRFLLGGMLGWMNYQYNDIPYGSWGSDLFYFSSFETPLRGTLYYDQIGKRFLLTNAEFRFPLVQYLILGWPIPWGFQNIRGAIFMDVGSAWNNDKGWKPFGNNESGNFQLHDLRMGYGVGARANLGFFLLKYDLAWGTNLNTVSKPIHYITLGAEF